MARVGFPFALVYVLALFSLLNEFSIVFLGMKPYITYITGPFALFAALASGRVARSWSASPGRWMILFVLWMTLAIPFSIYRGGSFFTMQDFVEKQFPAMLVLAVLLGSLRQVEWFCRGMAFSGLLVLAISLKYGGVSDNRLMIPGTSLENPNDFATHLLIALPFCLLMALNAGRSWVLRALGIVGVAGLALTLLRSGSRGAFMALIAVIGVLLWKIPARQRFAGLAVCVLCSVAAGVLFPQVLWNRFETIFSNEVSSDSQVSAEDARTTQLAEASTNSRWYILKRSVEFTIQNPVFGLGPGNFIVAEAGLAKDEGRRGSWLGTHNSYTQASSEGGIPAFLFFTAALVSSIRINSRIYSRTRSLPEYRKIANTALCLLLTLAGFAVTILFSHLAFTYYLPMMAGLTVAFSLVVDKAMRGEGQGLAPVRSQFS